MLDSSQISILSEMGIPVWQTRQTGVATNEALTTDSSDEIDITGLLARVDASNWLFCHDDHHSEQVQRLLKSICLAIGIDEGICLLSLSELRAIAPENITGSEQKQLVLFGESVVRQVFGSESTIESLRYDPQQALHSKLKTFVNLGLQSLLDQPEQKKQLWRDIRQLKQFNS